jgi:AcrR family transcriptional regulator
MLEALKLFSQNGYGAVSVRDIAKTLNITAGALYKHYQSKQDIFANILSRMEENDKRQAMEYHVPEETFEHIPSAYKETEIMDFLRFALAMFRYWTEDEFASAFRRMLTLEQYSSPEMFTMYQNYFGSGVLQYVEDILRESGYENPEMVALRFYGPFYFLLNQYDAASDKKEVFAKLQRHMKGIL